MGVDKKTTWMLIEVDLQCCRCYKKIKKVLCGIPQIQDQEYDEKENRVLIKVVCCSPEKIKKKIECQGGCSVKSVKEVVLKPKDKPEKPPEKAPEKPKEKPPVKPEEPGKPKKAKEPEKPKEIPPPQCPPPHCPPPHCRPPHCRPPHCPPPPCPPPPCPPPHCPPPHCRPPPCPPPHCPPRLPYPEFRTCCTECSEGRGGGPCYSGHGYYGRPIYDSYGGGGYRSSYVSQCDYFGEENSSGCSIM